MNDEEYIYQTLEDVSMDILYHAFLDAFSDYSVPMNLSFDDFQKMLRRRGFNGSCSVGVFEAEHHQLVGFIFNSQREWNGKKSAYDLGTGVVLKYRQYGLSKKLFSYMIELLKKNNIQQYILEVIKDNVVAFSLYQKQGLIIERELDVYRQKNSLPMPKHEDIIIVKDNLQEEWNIIKTFWDFYPSWQNSMDSVLASPTDFYYILIKRNDSIIGYGIVDKQSGDVPQMSVNKVYRREGIGSLLLKTMEEHCESHVLKMVNVDTECQSMKCFLEAMNFDKYSQQYEMKQDL